MLINSQITKKGLKINSKRFFNLTINKLLKLWNLSESSLSLTQIDRLDKYYSKNQSHLHKIIVQIIHYILKINKESLTEGIFRIPGNFIQIKELKQRLCETKDYNLQTILEENEQLTIGCVLKDLLKEYQIFPGIVKKLITEDILFDFNHQHTDFDDKKFTAIKYMNLLLTKDKRYTLNLIMQMIKHVVADPKTKMSILGLATIFAPNIVFGETFGKEIDRVVSLKSDMSMKELIDNHLNSAIRTLEELVTLDDLEMIRFTTEEIEDIEDQIGEKPECLDFQLKFFFIKSSRSYDVQKATKDFERSYCKNM